MPQTRLLQRRTGSTKNRIIRRKGRRKERDEVEEKKIRIKERIVSEI
jgi:hypothetical protein